MFNKIDKKIKILAQVLCWIGIVACVLTGIILIETGNILIGLLTAIMGSLLSWSSSFVLYGFGQLIENSYTIVYQNEKSHTHHSTSNPKTEYTDNSSQVQNNSHKSYDITIIDDTITCPACAFVQKSNRTFCWNCGAKFNK